MTTKSGKKKDDDDDDAKQKKSVEDGNIRSRAEQLLSVFPRKQTKEKKETINQESRRKSPTPETHLKNSTSASPIISQHQQASNEIEESIRNHQHQQPVGAGKNQITKEI